MKYQVIPIEDIRPYWRNPRRLTKESTDAVARSIKEYGFINPIVIDKDNTIVAGHNRYQAMVQLGKSEVPCVRVDLTEDQAKAVRIIDNRTAELSAWDKNLVNELIDITDKDFVESLFVNIDFDLLKDGNVLDDAKIAPVNLDRNITLFCPECYEPNIYTHEQWQEKVRDQ